jgi:Zn-dependent peptidase ImmA (M78 family)
MASTRSSLTRELRNAGITRAAIDAVWPEWWSAEAEQSLSAKAELRYTIARRLGISPTSLFEGQPKFIWRDNAKFKNLGDATVEEQAILTSFGTSVARATIQATPAEEAGRYMASAIRGALIGSGRLVDLPGILQVCWDIGIPVIKTNLLPLRRKLMQAMSVEFNGRYAILIGRNTRHPAWAAFVVTHELGHIFEGHVTSGSALLEIGDPLLNQEPDAEETQADQYALNLLTGSPVFAVTADVEGYSSAQVVEAASRMSRELKVDPGVIALCLAHATGRWAQTMNALKILPDQYLRDDVGVGINWLASQRFDWGNLSDERAVFLRTVMGSTSAG